MFNEAASICHHRLRVQTTCRARTEAMTQLDSGLGLGSEVLDSTLGTGDTPPTCVKERAILEVTHPLSNPLYRPRTPQRGQDKSVVKAWICNLQITGLSLTAGGAFFWYGLLASPSFQIARVGSDHPEVPTSGQGSEIILLRLLKIYLSHYDKSSRCAN